MKAKSNLRQVRMQICLVSILTAWSLFPLYGQATPPKALPPSNAVPAVPGLPQSASEVQTLLDAGKKEADAYRWTQALALYEQAAGRAHALGDKVGEANALRYISIVYNTTSRPQRALEYLQQALPLHRAAGDRVGEAKTLGNLGVVYWKIGQPYKSLDHLQQALTLSRAVGDKTAEAKVLGNLAVVYDTIGQPHKSLEYLQRALPVWQATGDRSGEAITLNNIGDLYNTVGQPQKALDYCQRALPLQRATGDKAGEGYTLNTIGDIYIRKGDFQKVLEYCGQALPLLRAAGDKAGEAYALTDIGHAYSVTDQPQKALESLQQALAIRQAEGNQAAVAYVLNTIGYAYTLTQQPQQALEYYRQALVIFQNVGDKAAEARTLGNIGILYSRQNNASKAGASLRQAIALLEALRHNLGELTEAKIAFLESSLSTYTIYLDLLQRQGRQADAFALVQQMKARALLDLFGSGSVNLLSHLTQEERLQLNALRAQPEILNRQMIAEGVKNEVGSKKRFELLQEQLRQAERTLSTFSDTLYLRHPEVAKARSVHTLTLPQAARLLPADTALLEYATVRPLIGKYVGDRILLFVVTADGQVSTHDVPALVPQLNQLAPAFRAACADPGKPYREQAQRMYRLLLGPAAKRIAGKRHLLICPDGPLWDVPFAALQDSQGEFVGARHLLTFAYSATGAQAALAKSARRHALGTVLALANPAFGGVERFGDDVHVPGQRPFDAPSRPFDAPSRPFDAPSRPFDAPSRPFDAPSRPFDAPSRPFDAPSRPFYAPSRDFLVAVRGGLKPLPGTQREADILRALYPSAAIYTGRNAQESVFKQQAGRYRYLHLASHAFFNDASPMLSSVFLAAPPSGDKEDGFLTARELFDLKLNADLVTLSACQTGRGESHSGEGMVGLTWALSVAGCPTQVVSQWSVDDAATAQLMTRFYRGLKAGQEKGMALQTAAKTLREQARYRHPYFWAPFILMGDWR